MSNTVAKQPNSFKRGLATGKRQIGMWLALDSPTATEMVAGTGYDWLLLDMEHICIDASNVAHHLRAAKGGTAEMVVRVPNNEPILIKRLLDVGVRSFMVPMVQSGDEARAAVAATRYPPHGIRGVAGNTRASDFNRVPDYFAHAHEEICIVAQIETLTAVDAIGAIGAVDGIDGLFIGPNDLAASMGKLGQMTAPEVLQTISLALERMRATGKAAGILNFVPAQARGFLAQGFSYVAVASDAFILARRSEALRAEMDAAS